MSWDKGGNVPGEVGHWGLPTAVETRMPGPDEIRSKAKTTSDERRIMIDWGPNTAVVAMSLGDVDVDGGRRTDGSKQLESNEVRASS